MAPAANQRIASHLDRPRHMYEDMRDRAGEYMEHTGEMIRERPWASAATTFAAGLGVGLGIALLVFRPQPRHEQLHHGLSEAVARVLPDALKRYFR